MKTWIIPLAILMVVPALGAAAPIVVGPVPEQLVEGHTVFTVLEQVNATTSNKTQYAAAVAVLVREAVAANVQERFPGVLWFNDQYLVDPVNNDQNNLIVRYPCTGAVIAVNAGNPDPRLAFTVPPSVPPTYIESYLITDPNDHQWNVDKWSYTSGGGAFMAWTVAIRDNQAGYSTADDGTSNCSPYAESNTLPNLVPCDGSAGSFNILPLRCDNEDYITPARTSALKYNAVLFFFLEDLLIPGLDKNHHSGAPVAGDDISGCQDTDPVFPDQWPCPAANDNAEGNSHPYNPFYVVPGAVGLCGYCVGYQNHGGSATAPAGTNIGNNIQYSHATRNIDLYYHASPVPALRQFRVIDTEGSTAPFFCEDDFAMCLPSNTP